MHRIRIRVSYSVVFPAPKRNAQGAFCNKEPIAGARTHHHPPQLRPVFVVSIIVLSIQCRHDNVIIVVLQCHVHVVAIGIQIVAIIVKFQGHIY